MAPLCLIKGESLKLQPVKNATGMLISLLNISLFGNRHLKEGEKNPSLKKYFSNFFAG